MKQSDLAALPPKVRERYNSLPATYFDDHPDVVRLRKDLAEAEARHKIPVDRLMQHRERQTALCTQRDEAQHAAARIEAARPALLARLLLAGEPLTEDDQAQERRRELARFVEAVTVALPAIEAHEQELLVLIHRARTDHEQDRLAVLLERLRTEEAHRYGREG